MNLPRLVALAGLQKKCSEIIHVEINIPLCKNDAKIRISSVIKGKWQNLWNRESRGRHLYCIQNLEGGERGNLAI